MLNRCLFIVSIPFAACACTRAQDSAPPEVKSQAAAVTHAGGAESTSVDTGQAIAFLEFLKSGEHGTARSTGFSVIRGGYWKNEQLLTFLDTAGVTFFDIDGDTTWHESAVSMRSRFARRSGMAFTMLVHLGHIYAQPELQYSRLRFSEDAAGLVVSVGDWYRLKFVHRGPRLRLAKIEYVMKETE